MGLPRTSVSPTACLSPLVTRPLLSLGELVALLLGSPGSGVVVPTGPARLPLATCAEEDACSLPPSSGGGGTGRSALPRRGTPCAPPSPPLECQHLSWQRDTSSMESLSCLWWWPTPSRASLAQSRLSSSSGGTRLGPMSPRFTPPAVCAPARES